MVDCLSLYEIAMSENIQVCYFPLPTTKSMSIVDEQGNRVIGMDSLANLHSFEKKTRFAHELGHCMRWSFYNRYTRLDIRQKHENKANKWAIAQCISVDDLDDAIADGCTEWWQLSERFGVTEDFVKKAVCWYTYGNVADELYF